MGMLPDLLQSYFKEEEKPSTIPIPSECVLIDIKEVISQQINVVSVISEDSGNKSSNSNNRTSSSDPTSKENAARPTTKEPKEEKKLSIIPIPSECVLADIKEVTKQPISVVRTINEDNGNGSSNPNNKMSFRRKKIPPH